MTVLFIVIGVLAWLAAMLLFGEWLVTRDWAVRHHVPDDEPPSIVSDVSSLTETPETPAHAGITVGLR